MTIIDLSMKCTQSELADFVGISQPAISALMNEGKIPRTGTLGELVLAYCQRLRDQAAERIGDGSLDLVQERAALARSQRISQDMKNDIARGEYAPVGLLADVLGLVSGAVVDRFWHLESTLNRDCPTLPDDAKATVLQVIASARNEWIRSTSKLVNETMDATDEESDSESSQDSFQDEDTTQ